MLFGVRFSVLGQTKDYSRLIYFACSIEEPREDLHDQKVGGGSRHLVSNTASYLAVAPLRRLYTEIIETTLPLSLAASIPNSAYRKETNDYFLKLYRQLVPLLLLASRN